MVLQGPIQLVSLFQNTIAKLTIYMLILKVATARVHPQRFSYVPN